MNQAAASPQQKPRNQLPDPHPRTPRVALPDGAIDAHMHLFGPADRYPFSATSKYVSDDLLPETYFEVAHVLGVDKAVLVATAPTPAT